MSVSLPIPEPRAEDDEDVHWALSTASALWARGEPQEALKWLRRAAETASDANRDARSLELFKAAAEFANGIQGMPKTSAPPAPPLQPASVPPAGWPTPGVVQMTVGNQHPPPQPRPQSSPPAPPHAPPVRQVPPALHPGGPPPLQRGGTLAPGMADQRSPPPMHTQGRGPIHPPPQRQGSSPNLQQPARGPTRGETQTWQPRAGQVPPAGPFHSGAREAAQQMPHSEVMAATVPQPPALTPAWQPPTDPSTSRIPITDVDAAIKKMEAQRVAAGSVKTLASNTSFEDLSDESVRKSAKSTKQSAVLPPARVASSPSAEAGTGTNGTAMSAQGLPPPGVVAPSGTAPVKSKRRATQTGRRGTKTDSSEPVTRIATVEPRLLQHAREEARIVGVPPPTVPGVPSGDVAIMEANGAPSTRQPSTAEDPLRFEDEGTMEQHATLVGVNAYDLDEQTNVLSGSEANLVLKSEHHLNGANVAANSAPKPDVSEADDHAPTSETPTENPPMEAPPAPDLRRPLTDKPPGDAAFRALSAHRVALHRTPTGAIEVRMLAPGEPTPSGRVGAILVPVDAVSSTALYELLAAKPPR